MSPITVEATRRLCNELISETKEDYVFVDVEISPDGEVQYFPFVNAESDTTTRQIRLTS